MLLEISSELWTAGFIFVSCGFTAFVAIRVASSWASARLLPMQHTKGLLGNVPTLPSRNAKLRKMQLQEAEIDHEVRRSRHIPPNPNQPADIYIEDEDPLNPVRMSETTVKRMLAECALAKRIQYFHQNPRLARTRIPIVIPKLESLLSHFH